MNLGSQDFIFLDFQTTGTVALTSDVIEAGWGLYRADREPKDQVWTTHLIALDEERKLSRTIQRLTGLSANYYVEHPSIAFETLSRELRAFLQEHAQTAIVIHFAQFKLPFLWKVIALEEGDERAAIQGRVICVHRLSKLMIPELKSFSLRAVAGYAGYATAEKKRSVDHLTATAFVWRYLKAKLEDEDIPHDLVPWLRAMKPREAKALPIHDQALRKKRLALPNTPGVYFFLDAFANILYVGKAANLKHRVNAYFRGKKTKGSRLNEMLTRAVDFRFVEVTSELEALLLENDEIKRNDPPYNRMLRVEGREVRGIRFNDLLPEPQLWGYRVWGPMSSLWMVQALRPFIERSDAMALAPAFMSGVTEEMVREAIGNLFAAYGIESMQDPLTEDWHQLAQIVWPIEYARLLRVPSTEEDEEEEVLEEEVVEQQEWTAEDVQAFLSDAYRHLLRQMFRSRWFLRLSHCRIEWTFIHDPDHQHEFRVCCGQLVAEGGQETASYLERLQCFDMQVYDRVGILYAELKKGLRRGDRIRLHLGPNHVVDQDFLKNRLRC